MRFSLPVAAGHDNDGRRLASFSGAVAGVSLIALLVRPDEGYSLSFLLRISEILSSEWAAYGIAALVSTGVIVTGSFVGFCIGFLVAMLSFRVGWARSAVSPVTSLMAPLPIVVWIPLSITIAGIGLSHVLLLIVVGASFTAYLYCLEALDGIPRPTLDTFRVSRTKGWGLIASLYLPKCVDGVSSIYRVYLAFAWVAVIIAEVGGDYKRGAWTGLGYKFYYSYGIIQAEGIVISLILIVISAYLLDWGFSRAFQYLNRWKVDRP